MRLFVGFGYNDRDSWIERQVFPVLECLGFTVAHGKGLHGQVLQQGVKDQLDQSDAAVGFFTLREGQEQADYTSHIWVRDEIVYFNAKDKPIVPIVEENVKVPQGLLGDRQHIVLAASRIGWDASLNWSRRWAATTSDGSSSNPSRISCVRVSINGGGIPGSKFAIGRRTRRASSRRSDGGG